jgi:hypothetical protein
MGRLYWLLHQYLSDCTMPRLKAELLGRLRNDASCLSPRIDFFSCAIDLADGRSRYDHVGCCANETTMKEQGQALIDTGLQKLGFVYVNSDCGWMGGRHPNGTLYESPTKFRESLPPPLRLLQDCH